MLVEPLLESMLEPELPECDGLDEDDEPDEDGLVEDEPEPLRPEPLEPLAQSIDELFFAVVPEPLGLQSVEELLGVEALLPEDDGLELELEPEPMLLEPLLPPEPDVLEPEEPPVEGEAAVAPLRLCWLSLELVLLPAA